MLKNITPPEAWKKFQNDSDTVILDVRSAMEYEYVGHPLNAIHVPLMEAPDWKPIPDFTQKVRQTLESLHNKDPQEMTVMAMCRSGKRSEAAANALIADGFESVYNIAEGFEGDRDKNGHRSSINGWRFHGLPWEQS